MSTVALLGFTVVLACSTEVVVVEMKNKKLKGVDVV